MPLTRSLSNISSPIQGSAALGILPLFLLALAGGAIASGCRDLPTHDPPARETVQGEAYSEEDSGPASGESRRLDPEGETLVRPLRKSEAHDYLVDLAAGEALSVVVDQQGVDVVVELHDPQDQLVLGIDSPIDDIGPEELCFVAEEAGSYRITVQAWRSTDEGPYALRWAGVRPSAPGDRSCHAATLAFAEVERLRNQRGAAKELIRRYEDVLSLWRSADQPFQEAVVWKRLAETWSRQGNVKAQARCFENALALFRRIDNRHQEILVLSRLGRAYYHLGNLESAMSSHEEALRIARETHDLRGEATVLNNLSLLERSMGEAHLAIDHLKRVSSIGRSLGKRRQQATALHNLGVTYSEELGRFAEAIDALEESLAIWRDTGDVGRQAAALVDIGWARYRSGDPGQAVHHYLHAVELSRIHGDRSLEAAALDRLGTAYSELELRSEALAAYERALELSVAAGNRRNEAHIRANLGWFHNTGSPREARYELERAYRLLRRVGDRDALAHVRVGQASAEWALGDLGAARRYLEEALEPMESLRRSALTQGARLGPHPLWQDYYELYVDLLMELDQKDVDDGAGIRAFEISDWTRARNLYEILLESDVDLRGEAEAKLLAREREVLAHFEAMHQQRRGMDPERSSEEDLRNLEKTRRALTLELEEVRREIRMSNPRFAEIRWPTPVTLAQVQALLNPGTLLLSYALGEHRSFLFMVGPTTLTRHVLPPREEIETRARAAYAGLRNASGRRGRIQARLAAEALAEALLEPLRDESVKRLVVVADGALSYIPFAALPRPGAGGEELLIDTCEVVHLPSATALTALRRRAASRNPAPKELAVFADPVFSPADSRVEQASGRDPAISFRPSVDNLPSSRREAEAILRWVPPEQRLEALSFAATRELATSGALRAYKILHFATHAVIDEAHPGSSRIALSQVDEAGNPVAGDLRLQEIYTLDLPAELVVLSACQTALGRKIRGDGLVGLTRGFFYAGATRLVVSLWDVDDEATARLMTAFYRGLFERGLSPAAALREAQLELRRGRWRIPYYWAGFVLQGDWR